MLRQAHLPAVFAGLLTVLGAGCDDPRSSPQDAAGSSGRNVAPAEQRAQIHLQILNECQMALYEITENPDLTTVELVYQQVLNDLNLEHLTDPDVLQVVLRLLDSIHEIRQSGAKEDFTKTRLSQLQKEYVLREIAIPVLALASPALKYNGAGTTLQVDFVTSKMLHQLWDRQRQCQDLREKYKVDLVEIDAERLNALHAVNRQLLEAATNVIQRHGLSDADRVTVADYRRLAAAIAQENPAQRLRELEYLEEALADHPPYWFWRGVAHQTIYETNGRVDRAEWQAADAAFERYLASHNNIYREGRMTHAARLARAALLDPAAEPELVEAHLAPTLKQLPDDPPLLLRAAQIFSAAGLHEPAIRAAQASADRGRDPVTYGVELLRITAVAGDTRRVDNLLMALASNERIPHDRVLAALSATPDKAAAYGSELFREVRVFRRQDILQPWKPDHLIFETPLRWTADGLPTATLAIGGENVEALVDRDENHWVFRFPNVLRDDMRHTPLNLRIAWPMITCEIDYRRAEDGKLIRNKVSIGGSPADSGM